MNGVNHASTISSWRSRKAQLRIFTNDDGDDISTLPTSRSVPMGIELEKKSASNNNPEPLDSPSWVPPSEME
eukprot:15214110-Ditylum_brightwellii.AAC.1